MDGVEEVSNEILRQLWSDFSGRALTSSDLADGYEGPNLAFLREKLTGNGASGVDFDLAMKELEKARLVATGPLVPFDNQPGSGVFVMGLFSNREYAFLTEKGYKASQKARSARSAREITNMHGGAGRGGAAADQMSGTAGMQPLAEPSGPTPIRVFASYSHRDEALHDELAKHLKALEREGIIQPWHDRRITAGKELDVEIDVALNLAGIILLLVSPDFIASDYCWGKEMRRAMERHAAGEARVIPIILRSVDWHNAPFGKLLALPTDGKAVMSWTNKDDALLDIARGIRAAAVDVGSIAGVNPPVTLEIRGSAYRTDYRAVIIEADLRNHCASSPQVTRCSLELPSFGVTLEHARGPLTLTGGASWLPGVPFELGPRKLTRGRLFFSARVGPLKDGAFQEPLHATLTLEFFLEPAIKRDLEIYTFETLRARAHGDQATSSSQSPPAAGPPPRSPAEKLRSAAERRRKEEAEKREEQQRSDAFAQAALAAAPQEFEALADLLRHRGEAWNAEHLPGVPTLSYHPVNHRLDVGSTYSIELSPYAQMRAFTAIVLVGLHPNAAQTHVELPDVETTNWRFQARVDERGFSWVDEKNTRWSPAQIIDGAMDKLADLLSAEPGSSGGLDLNWGL
jgi:hypothetical protein